MQRSALVTIVRDIQQAKESVQRHPAHATYREVKARCRGVADNYLVALLDEAVEHNELIRRRTINCYAYEVAED